MKYENAIFESFFARTVKSYMNRIHFQEFSAYKNHSKKLLEQERELNEKLRHLAG